MEKLEVLNQDLVVDGAKWQYNYIHKLYLKAAQEAIELFCQLYEKKCKSLDEVMEKGHEIGISVINYYLDFTLKLIHEAKIYTLNKNILVEKYFDSYEYWESAFDELKDIYNAIGNAQVELEELREQRKQFRGRVVGGGFGLSSAVKGMLQAEAMNIAAGIAHSTINTIANANTAKKIEIIKDKIYNDPETLQDLCVGISLAVYNLKDSFNKVMWDYLKINNYGYNKQDMETAKAIYDNIMNGVIPQEQISKLFVAALDLYPYCEDIYQWLIINYGDSDGEIFDVAEFFGIDLSDFLDEYIINTCDKLISLLDLKENGGLEFLGTSDEAQAVITASESLDYNEVRKNIIALCENLCVEAEDYLEYSDEQRREQITLSKTADGIVYETKEIAEEIKNLTDINNIAFRKLLHFSEYRTYSNFLSEEDIAKVEIARKICKVEPSEQFVYFIDSSGLGNSKEGILMTTHKLYFLEKFIIQSYRGTLLTAIKDIVIEGVSWKIILSDNSEYRMPTIYHANQDDLVELKEFILSMISINFAIIETRNLNGEDRIKELKKRINDD